MTKEQVQAFLDALTELSRKHGIVVHLTPHETVGAKPALPENGEYRIDRFSGGLLIQFSWHEVGR